MKYFDNLLLRVKRKDGALAAATHDAYRWLLRWNMPEPPLVRHVYETLFLAYDAIEQGSELIAAKLLYEPMVRARFEHVGEGLHVTGLPYLIGHCSVRVGDHCTLSKILIESGRFCDSPELRIGSGTTIGHQVRFSVNRSIVVGDHVGIASRANLSDSDGHPRDLDRRLRGEPLSESDIRPVTIGDHAWIGRGAHVLKGVTIGRGAVVAAGSVVASNVPDGALAMGVPARVITRPWETAA